jgi:hypothetical protein
MIRSILSLLLAFAVTSALTPDPAEAQRRGGGGGGHAARGGGGGHAARGGAHQSVGGGGGNRSAARSAGAQRPASANTGANRGSMDRTAGANRGNVDRTAGADRGNVDRGNVDRGDRNVDRGDRNVDRDTNIGSNNDINIDVDDGWGGGDWDYHPIAAGVAFGTAAAVTSAAIGSMYYSLPSSCPPYPYGGYTYHYCNNVWYQPQYSGSTVNYVVIDDPR